MRIHQIIPISSANGPGKRFVVWVQGCSRKCLECFNPLTHDKNGGEELSIQEIIKNVSLSEVYGITVSGGEPFEQTEELALLLDEAGQKGLNRLVYTGYTFEELLTKEDKAIEGCLSLIDILIDGPYKRELPPKLPWTGSGNQRILGLEQGKIVKIYDEGDINKHDNAAGELIIDSNGGITASGIIDTSWLIYDKI